MRTSAAHPWIAIAAAALVGACNEYVVDSGSDPAATCSDGQKNGSETGVDCGGTCPACTGCDPSQCPSGACAGDVCAEDGGAGGAGGAGGEPGAALWSKAWGSEFTDYSEQVSTDASDNVYVMGFLGASVDYDSGVESEAPLTPTAPGIFVVKFDAAGNYLWDRVFDATSGFVRQNLDLYVTPDGSAYLTGGFRQSVDLGPGCALSNGDDSSRTTFLAKLGPDGVCAWAKKYGDGAESYGAGVRMNAGGEILLLGGFLETMTLGTTTLSNQGGLDSFVAKLDATGNPIWAKAFGGPADDYADAAIDDQGRVVVYVGFKEQASLDGMIVTSEDDYDLFVIKYDADGNQLWAHPAGGPGYQFPVRVPLDRASGDLVLIGQFEGSFDYLGHTFQGATSVQLIFALKIAADGGFVWGSEFPWGVGHAGDAQLDPVGDLVFGGVSGDGSDFGGGVLPKFGTSDAIVVKLDGRTGGHVFSTAYGGLGTSYGGGLALDTHGHAVISGQFDQQITFGDTTHTAAPGADPCPESYLGCDDTFLAKLFLP